MECVSGPAIHTQKRATTTTIIPRKAGKKSKRTNGLFAATVPQAKRLGRKASFLCSCVETISILFDRTERCHHDQADK